MPIKIKPEEAISKMKAMWPEYDFSKFTYNGSYSESIVICPRHGEVTRTFKNVTRKNGIACGQCAISAKRNTESFIEEIKQIYPDTWMNCSYSKVSYVDSHTYVNITCKEHGDFSTQPISVISKKRRFLCSKCNIKKRAKDQADDINDFIEKASSVHIGLDTFENTKYVSSKTLSEINCKVHGSYMIRPGDYLSGKRCSHCSLTRKSSPELEIFEFIKGLRPDAISRVKPVEGLKMELDIYIPSLSLGIEYNGLFFHRDPSSKWDKFEGAMASSNSLFEKTESYLKAGIRIIHVLEDEWLEKQDIIKNKLRSILTSTKKVFARKCEIKQLTNQVVKEFESNNHIQGHAYSSSFRYGLFYENNLVGCMTFSKFRFEDQEEDCYELLRYSTSTSVIGGFSKLLKHFIRNQNPKRIVSYSDRRWSIGGVYWKNGFAYSSSSQPGYFWCKGQRRFNRVSFQRHKLEDIFKEKYPKEMTESEIMYKNGYFKIKDCGQDRWVLILK